MNKEIVAAKKKVIDTVAEAFKNAQSVSVIEYRGLTVNELEVLRKDLRKENAELKVFKNTLVEKAVEELGYKELKEILEGPNALVFSHTDAVTGPRIVSKFAKAHENLIIKGGIVEGKAVTDAEMKVIATLPGKEGLLSMLLSCLQSPVRGFACAVKAIAEKKEQVA